MTSFFACVRFNSEFLFFSFCCCCCLLLFVVVFWFVFSQDTTTHYNHHQIIIKSSSIIINHHIYIERVRERDRGVKKTRNRSVYIYIGVYKYILLRFIYDLTFRLLLLFSRRPQRTNLFYHHHHRCCCCYCISIHEEENKKNTKQRPFFVVCHFGFLGKKINKQTNNASVFFFGKRSRKAGEKRKDQRTLFCLGSRI